MKSLSLFLSFIVVFLLFASTLDSFREIERIVAALVLGGVVVAVAALYEGHTYYNVFDTFRMDSGIRAERAGDPRAACGPTTRPRIRPASDRIRSRAQMVLPFAVYLASRAKTQTDEGFLD